MGESKFIKTLWTAGNEKNKVEVEFTYDLTNLGNKITKQWVGINVMGKEGMNYKLSKECPCVKVQTSVEEAYFGLDGEFKLDLKKKTVIYEGLIDVLDRQNWKQCPPPFPFKAVVFQLPVPNLSIGSIIKE